MLSWKIMAQIRSNPSKEGFIPGLALRSPRPKMGPQTFMDWYDKEFQRRGGFPDRKIVSRHYDPGNQAAFDLLLNFRQHIVFEDPHLIVINKPPHISSHTNEDHDVPGVLDIALHHTKYPPGMDLAHRLDKPTTGLLVLAKTAEANEAMARQFADKSESGIVKTYLALVEGEWTTSGTQAVDVKIAPRRDNPKLMKAFPIDTPSTPDMRRALSYFTQVAILRRQNRAEQPLMTLMEVEIVTGRTHQIRVSAQAKGHPLVGDVAYRGSQYASRPMLHAARLQFTHPITGERLDLHAPLPADFKAAINADTSW